MEKPGIKVFIVLSLLLSACQSSDFTDSLNQGEPGRVVLDVKTDVADIETSCSEPIGGSRSVYTGTTLNESGRTYGIMITEHNDTPTDYAPYDAQNLYGNIQAWYGNYSSKGTKWWYSFQSTSGSRFNPLYLVTDDTSRHFDIYAYSPWKAGITIENGYSYNLNSVKQDDLLDLMYATYEDEDGFTPTNLNKTFDKNNPVPVKIHFHHALSRIVFHFKLANSQNIGIDGQTGLRLFRISLNNTEGAITPLYTQGRMNILTGEVTTMQARTSFEQIVDYATGNDKYIYSYDIVSSDNWSDFNMLVHPIPYQADDDFFFRIYFNSSAPSNKLVHTYNIKRSDLLHADGTYGFQSGYVYHFYFIIDNYIHLKNVIIKDDWTNTDEEEIKI